MTTKSFIKTIGSKGLLSDYNTEGKKLLTEESVDQTYSPTSTKAQSGVAVNEAFKTRETSSNDDSYTYIGMKKSYGSADALYWKLVSFNAVNNYWTLQFEVDVSNGRKGNNSYDTEIYETKRLTICGINPGDVTYANELRYAAQGIDSSRGYSNNIYYEIGSDKLVTVYIKAINRPNKTQICRLTSLRNFQGISNITWHEATENAGTQPTNPVKFKEVFPAIASTTSNIGSDSVPVYVNKGTPVVCNSSNLKAGKDDDGNVIKTTYQKKLTFDTTPTAGSTNPVTSDGINSALASKANAANFVAARGAKGFMLKFPIGLNLYDGVFINILNAYGGKAYRNITFAIRKESAGAPQVDRYNTDVSANTFPGGKNFSVYYGTYPSDPNTNIILIVPSNNISGLVNLSWGDSRATWTILYNTPDTTGLSSITPIEHNNVFGANKGSASVPVYVNANGEATPCTDDFVHDSDLDSRIPAPTSTTGTQVLKCINGVIQWVNE